MKKVEKKKVSKEQKITIGDLMKVKQFLSQPCEAHSEITVVLPNGVIVKIPAKNPHLLKD